MTQIKGEVLIRGPVEKVFAFVADERNEPTYNPNTLTSEKVTEGPIGVGTRFTATVRARRGGVGMQIEDTAVDRPHLLASTSRDGDGGLHRHPDLHLDPGRHAVAEPFTPTRSHPA